MFRCINDYSGLFCVGLRNSKLDKPLSFQKDQKYCTVIVVHESGQNLVISEKHVFSYYKRADISDCFSLPSHSKGL